MKRLYTGCVLVLAEMTSSVVENMDSFLLYIDCVISVVLLCYLSVVLWLKKCRFGEVVLAIVYVLCFG